MDCYNYDKLDHLAHQCFNPKKNKFKDKKDDLSDDDEKKINKAFKKIDRKKRRFHEKEKVDNTTLLVFGIPILIEQMICLHVTVTKKMI